MIKKLFFISLFFSCLLNATGNPDDYRIGIDPNWYPNELNGREANLLGYARDVVQEIAKIEKAPLSTVESSTENLIFDLKKKKYKGILSAMKPYPFLLSTYDFSSPFLMTGPVLVVPSEAKITSLAQLSGKIVALPQGTSGAMIMEKYPGIVVRFYNSVPEVLLSLEAKLLDGAIVNNLTAESYCRDIYQGKLKVATLPLAEDGFRLISIHGEANDLQQAFESGLKKLKTQKILEKLQKKWGLRS